jgi:CDP-paratose 2-epimerase
MTSILITGGAGFVGSNLAVALRQASPSFEVTALDNLLRRGSELALVRLKQHGVGFRHGDIRCREDLDQLPPFDLLVDCSAEPSVHAGVTGSPLPVIAINLLGTVNCLELARRHRAAVLFLSTSRVYPIEAVNRLPFRELETRYEWTADAPLSGFGPEGIAEEFPLAGARSFYGATKLSAELLLEEYRSSYGVPVLVNRCGVLAGPWQMGKVDQGVVTLWVARHHFRRPLRYTGFGRRGKQVRDILHVDDLCDLVLRQLERMEHWDGSVYNVGGGRERSVSLCELTALCSEATGGTVEIGSQPETSPVDVRIYVTDSRKVQAEYAWSPQRSLVDVVADIASWLEANEADLRGMLE